MADRKDKIWGLSFDVSEKSLANLRDLETLLSKIELSGTRLKNAKSEKISVGVDRSVAKQVSDTKALHAATDAALKERAKLEEAFKRPLGATSASGGNRIAEAIEKERIARDRLSAAIATYRAGMRQAEREGVAAERNIEKAIRADETATKRAAAEAIKSAKQRAAEERKVEIATLRTEKAAEKAAKQAARAREQFKDAFLSIGASSSVGFGSMVRNAGAAALAFMSLHRVLQKIGESKDRYLRFDEITTATMVITNAGNKAFEYGSKGAERYRNALRAAADDVKTSSAEMASSAAFWAKAGQTNADTMVELSKIGTMFSRANLDSANNIMDQTRANDILSDSLQLFRKDTSTTAKAIEAATDLADKMTAASNAGNIDVEQLFDFSKKVGALFKAGDAKDSEILAIATSLSSAGLKDESGVHVKRIVTALADKNTQKMLKGVGVDVADKQGNIRSFGDIFGELQGVLKTAKPLERMEFLQELFGQHALATAAALAGLNEQGLEGNTASVKFITERINEGTGLVARNQEQYLKTTSGRVQALTSTWSNALDKILDDSGIIQKVLSGLEGIDPKEVFQWLEKEAVPALEKIGETFSKVVIPGVQMTAQSISQWMSPALSMLSGLLGGTTSSAEGFSDTLTTIVKLWVKWRIALLAIKGLRMLDWFSEFTKKALAAATATRAIESTTTKSVTGAKAAVGGLAGAFSVAGLAITAAIAAWGLYDAMVGPIDDAEKRIDDFRGKYGKDLERLSPGKEDFESLQGKIKDTERILKETEKQTTRVTNMGGAGIPVVDAYTQEKIDTLRSTLDRLKAIQSQQVQSETGAGKNDLGVGRYEGGKSTMHTMDRSVFYRPGQDKFQTISNYDKAFLNYYGVMQSKDADLIATAQAAYEDVLNQKLSQYQDERAALQKERDETFLQFTQAVGDDRDTLYKQLGVVVDRLKENADGISKYTSDLDSIAEAMSQSGEEQQQAEADKAIEKERASKRLGSFHGGKTKELNPFATPLLSGVDEKGHRVINLALQPGNAAEYYKKSPESRQMFEREFRAKNPNVYNINFGDNSLTVTTKSNADPERIAKAVKDEWWKIGQRQKHDVERVLGITAPPEI